MTTRDGKDYVFSAAGRPGVVYLPKVGAASPPENETTPKRPADRTNARIGMGFEVGTQVNVAGNENLGGHVASLDDMEEGASVAASPGRRGPLRAPCRTTPRRPSRPGHCPP
jgi:hypothetical protein